MFPARYYSPAHYPTRYFPPDIRPVFSFRADAILRALQSGTFDATAVVRKPTSSTTTASAILQSIGVASLDANAILLTKQTAQIAIDAILLEASTPFFVDAVLLSPRTGDFYLDAWLEHRSYGLDAVTDIHQLDFLSSFEYIDHQPTWTEIGTFSTAKTLGFDGGLSFTQMASSIEAIASVLSVPDIEFEQTTRVIDFTSGPRTTVVTSTTRMIDFQGGVEEVDDG